jgi:hypothetical protein
MKIWQNSENDDIILSMSLLEYKRLFFAVTDHALEYCGEEDMLTAMLETMEKFNGE